MAVTAGYISPEPRREFFEHMDAANIDLKSFSDDFYYKICGARLQPILDTLEYVKHETGTWLELTTLLIPGENDSSEEIDALTRWVAQHLGPDVPLHFSAFHPDWKMADKPHTPPATLTRARDIALRNGLHYVYTGNVHDSAGGSTYCPSCKARVIERDWYRIGAYRLTDDGHCSGCGATIPGVFAGPAGSWGGRRQSVRITQPRR